MQAPTQPNAPSPLIVPTALWFGLMGSVVMLGLTLTQMAAGWEPKEGFLTDLDDTVMILMVAAAALIPASFIVPQMLLSHRLQFFRRQPGDLALRARMALFVPMIVRWALIDAISIFGFLCASMKQNMQYYYLGGAVALALFLISRPTMQMFKDAERALSGMPHGNIG